MYHQVIQIDRQVVGLEEGVPTVIDPVTAIGLATTAFNALKKGIAVGKDLQDMGGQLTQWAGAISDLDFQDSMTDEAQTLHQQNRIPLSEVIKLESL